MKPFNVYPKGKKQMAAIKAVLKALDIPFEVVKSQYNPEFVAEIQESREQVKKGETRIVDVDDL